MRKVWVITGSSRGLGRAFAEAALEFATPAWSTSIVTTGPPG